MNELDLHGVRHDDVVGFSRELSITKRGVENHLW